MAQLQKKKYGTLAKEVIANMGYEWVEAEKPTRDGSVLVTCKEKDTAVMHKFSLDFTGNKCVVERVQKFTREVIVKDTDIKLEEADAQMSIVKVELYHTETEA